MKESANENCGVSNVQSFLSLDFLYFWQYTVFNANQNLCSLKSLNWGEIKMSFDQKNQAENPTLVRVKLGFRMMIDDLFFIRQIGTLVTGNVESGICSVGEKALIIHNGKEIETKITIIHFFTKEHKQENTAYPNERVGLGLKGITKEQLIQKEIDIGDWIIVRNEQVEVM